MEQQTTQPSNPPPIQVVESVVIRFCGDSGDGMQLTGTEFTRASALALNDLATLPDFPAEIRAPAGTLFGVSGYQINFGSQDIYTPGDQPDVLVAMNPAAYKVNLPDLVPGGILIVNTGAFTAKNLELAGYPTNPLDDESLGQRYRLVKIDISKLTTLALGRGIGDCGIQTRWRFDGQRFRLVRYAEEPSCDSWNGPDAWPTLWITR